MHNRKKPDAPPSEVEVNALKEKTTKYKALVDMILHKRKQGDRSPETLVLVGKLIQINPDFYSLWNMRREILFSMYPALIEASPENRIDNTAVRDAELSISADGIRRNPKAYGAWHHRLWIADRFTMDYEQELNLCEQFLREDQRNFHCWNYRRDIHLRSGLLHSQEFDFTTKKIQENFSNYSAFHQRSKYLQFVIVDGDLKSVMEGELSLVENAIFTEPDDQSGWWYQQFLFTWLQHQLHVAGVEDNTLFTTLLQQQITLVDSLLDLEPNSRWAMNSLVFLMDFPKSMDYKERRHELLAKLKEIDPIHANRYNYLQHHYEDKR